MKRNGFTIGGNGNGNDKTYTHKKTRGVSADRVGMEYSIPPNKPFKYIIFNGYTLRGLLRCIVPSRGTLCRHARTCLLNRLLLGIFGDVIRCFTFSFSFSLAPPPSPLSLSYNTHTHTHTHTHIHTHTHTYTYTYTYTHTHTHTHTHTYVSYRWVMLG